MADKPMHGAILREPKAVLARVLQGQSHVSSKKVQSLNMHIVWPLRWAQDADGNDRQPESGVTVLQLRWADELESRR